MDKMKCAYYQCRDSTCLYHCLQYFSFYNSKICISCVFNRGCVKCKFSDKCNHDKRNPQYAKQDKMEVKK